MVLSEAVQNALSKTMQWSARNAWTVLSVVALLTIVAGTVLATVEPNVETDIQAGYFSQDDEQANFFRELREDVAGVSSEIVYFELTPDATAPDADDPRCSPGAPELAQPDCPRVPVTDVQSMEALRAQDELFEFVKTEFVHRTAEMGINGGQGVDKVLSHTSLVYFQKLIYKQFPDGCFCLPPDQATHDASLALLGQADSTGAVALYRSDDNRSAVMIVIFDPDTTHLSKKETGGLINEIIADYRQLNVGQSGDAGVIKNYDLWEDDYFDSWGVQSWIYRIDEQVEKESTVFVGAVFGFLTLALLVLFRNLKRALIGVVTVAIILTWTLAGMTLGDVSIGFVSMAMFPLLLGVGVDYVIHIVNEFGTERAHTERARDAFDLIGRRGAVALLISTLTTITGFVVMISSTSPMIVEIGTATILGIASVFILSITFVPALLQLSVRNEKHEVFRPSKAVGAFCHFWGKNKAITILMLVLGTAGFASSIPNTEYVIGTVEVNLPQKEMWTHKDDRAHMLDMYERFQVRIESVGQETIITKAQDPCDDGETGPCGLATKAAVDDMIRIHKGMIAEPFVQAAGGGVNSVPFILNLYALLESGAISAAAGIGQGVIQGGQFLPCDEFPEQAPCGAAEAQGETWDNDFGLIADWTDADVRAAYDDMKTREEFSPLLLTFISADYNIGWALTFINLEVDQSATERADAAFAGVLERAEPTATDNQYFGTLTGIKKYNDYTNYWLTLSTAISLLIVAVLVGTFTRSFRAVAATVTPMVITFVWWLGALPLPIVNIDLAFIFMIPIAFITSLGSDYAVHMTWNLEKQADPKFVFRTVGKAVAYSGFTTAVSFYVFTRGAIRGSYEMFEAAVIAIVMMTFLSLVTIPLFYVRKGKPVAED